MPVQYAKDQPAGFTNRMERVAIIGAGGQIGRPITEALLQTGKHTITAITRKDSANKLPDGVKIVQLNYDDQEALIAALKGQQMLIITLSVMVAPDTQDKIVKAAAAAGVPHVMPNAWGSDAQDTKLNRETLIGERYIREVKFIEEAGLAWTNLCCSFWYEYSLASPFAYGFDMPNKTATLYGEGNVQINTTTFQQCGRAVASFLSLKLLPEDENDQSPSISAWRNKSLYVASFLLSQREMLDSIQRAQGTSDADWQIKYQPVEERYAWGLELFKGGDRKGFGIAMYARTFFPGDAADYENRYGLDNEKLGLPKEDLDEVTAQAMQMMKSA